MTPGAILAAVQAGAEAMSEFFRFLCTEQGQALVKKNLEDQVKFEKFVSTLGGEVDKFFHNIETSVQKAFEVK